jgi:inorganic pyrophosphatase
MISLNIQPGAALRSYDEHARTLNVIIETPKGSRNKYAFDEKLMIFGLKKVLPLGTVFPFDFGFVPGTLAEDGDPLDILVLMDAPAFTGCLVPSRIVGVLEAEQTEDGKSTRNDRIIATCSKSKDYSDITSLKDVNKNVIDEITTFFEYYNRLAGKKFCLLGTHGPKRAQRLIEDAIAAHERQ